MNYQQTIEITKHRSSMLRKMLSDTLYFDPRFGVETNSYQKLLTDLQYKLHQQVNRSRKRNYDKPSHNVPRKLSKRQIEVIENAIDRYERWLTKDKDNPEFISTRHKQMNLVDKLNSRFFEVWKKLDEVEIKMNEYLPRQVIPLVKSLKTQLFQRKLLLTKAQKIYCNDLYAQIKELESKSLFKKSKETG